MNDSTVTSRFRIEGPLGKGGMGEVFRAWDTVLARYVALKWIRNEQRADASASGRFLREARAAASLRHPNIVTIYDLGEEGGASYIVMELLEGRPLSALLGDASISPRQRLTWLREIATALATAHHAGLVHRDVKPGNVMVCHDGAVKILDFGLAKRTGLVPMHDGSAEVFGASSFRTAHGAVIGTPSYMAPEQARGEHVDARVDQFSWGVLAYELMTGHRWRLTMRDAPVLPSASAEVVAVLRRATEASPSARFPSMSALIAVLDGAVGTSGISAATPTGETRDASYAPSALLPASLARPPLAPDSARRSSAPILVALALLAVGVVAIGAAFAWREWRAPALTMGAVPSASPSLIASSAAPGTQPNPTSAATGSTASSVAKITPSSRPAPVAISSGQPTRPTTAAPPPSVTPSASATPPPAAVTRIRYGGELSRDQVTHGMDSFSCPGCEFEPFAAAIDSSYPLFAPCFLQTAFDPPFHGYPRFEIAVSADGKYGATRQVHPTPGNTKLTACVARAIRSVPLIKHGGGPGVLNIEFNDRCNAPVIDGRRVWDQCDAP